MKILCVHPGADYSTADVYNGLVPALRAEGAECFPYSLDTRIAVAGKYLRFAWQEAGEIGPPPNDADVAYKASMDALERALRLNVDWVLVFSAMYFHPDALILLRKAGLKIGIILTESPYEDSSEMNVIQWADIAWTNERCCVDQYRSVNTNTLYLPPAYDPQTHRPGLQLGDADLPAHDVVFVGTPFPERIHALESVDWDGIDLGLYGFWDEALLPISPLRPYLKGGIVDNKVAAGLYRRAKIGLNLYRTSRAFDGSGGPIAHAESVNPRALELAACQVCQVSDYRQEVWEVFGRTVRTVSEQTPLELLIRQFLGADAGARQIVAKLAAEKLSGWTFRDRARQVLAQLDATASYIMARNDALAAAGAIVAERVTNDGSIQR